MSYTLTLSNEEISALAWATNHGYFPADTYDAMHPASIDDTSDDPKAETVWLIPEHAAWSITMLREENPDACFACLGGPLLEKLLTLENSIV